MKWAISTRRVEHGYEMNEEEEERLREIRNALLSVVGQLFSSFAAQLNVKSGTQGGENFMS